MQKTDTRWRSALKAAGLHLLLSVLVAACAAAVVFGVWYPCPYREMSGGRELFFLVISVDVVCGPLLTLAIFNPHKSRRELCLDLGLVALLQLGALSYGLYTVTQARPVYMVFEVDRLRVVSAADIDPTQLHLAPTDLQQLPWTGPTLIGARRSKSNEELMGSLDAAAAGVEISMQPSRWVPYEQSRPEVLQRARPLSVLTDKHPEAKARLETAADKAGLKPADTLTLPVMSRFASWTALLNKQGDPVAYVEVDAF